MPRQHAREATEGPGARGWPRERSFPVSIQLPRSWRGVERKMKEQVAIEGSLGLLAIHLVPVEGAQQELQQPRPGGRPVQGPGGRRQIFGFICNISFSPKTQNGAKP